jgi:hypothetical protein
MVPVLDVTKKPLMPCSEKRARTMLEKGEAKSYFSNGIFCIILKKEPSNRIYQDIVVGVDPGSKREGYTVSTKKRVVLNILSDTPYSVKEAVEARAACRKSRRRHNTPYRKCRSNRLIGGIPHSTKARWGAKLRMIAHLLKIIPINFASIEDIKAKTKFKSRKWNVNFSPLEVGKIWFYKSVEEL